MLFIERNWFYCKVQNGIWMLLLNNLLNNNLIFEDNPKNFDNLFFFVLCLLCVEIERWHNFHQNVKTCFFVWNFVHEIVAELCAFFTFFISWLTAISFIGFSKNTLNPIYNSEKVICFISDLSLGLFLNYFLVNDFQRQAKIIDDISLCDKIKRHILTYFSDFISNPFMKSSYCITFQVLGFNLSNWKIDVLDWSSFVLLFLLHFFFRYFQSDDEVRSLRSEDFIDVIEVEVFFGWVVPLQTKHEFSLFFNRFKHLIEGLNSFPNISIPNMLVFTKLFDKFNGILKG